MMLNKLTTYHHKLFMCCFTALILLFHLSHSTAEVIDPYGFTKQQQRQQFTQLTTSLRCLVCQNQTLAESEAPLAQDLRRRIADDIIAGKTNQQIIHSLTQLYGNFVHYQPPFNRSTWLLWLGPFLLLAFGISILLLIVYKQRESC